MDYKTELQSNNADLQALIAKANALPDVGSGGGSVETCTVTIAVCDTPMTAVQMVYVDAESNPIVLSEIGGFEDSYTLLKNSLLVFDCECSSEYTTIEGDIELITTYPGTFLIKGTGSISN